MGAHPEEELLVGLAGAVDPHVRHGGGGQDAAERVERLRPYRLPVDEVGVGTVLGVTLPEPVLQHRHERRVGVVEGVVEHGDVTLAQRATQLGRHVVAIAAARPVVVRNVARGLLEVRHQPAPLEHLGQDVRGALDRQVHTAQLRDRVVAVLEEDPVVELLGALEADGGVDPGVAARVELTHELVEEEPA